MKALQRNQATLRLPSDAETLQGSGSTQHHPHADNLSLRTHKHQHLSCGVRVRHLVCIS